MPHGGEKAVMDVLVVGAGQMGRWLGSTLDPIASITYLDRDEEIAAEAAAMGAATAVTAGIAVDVVAIAVPISATSSVLEAYAPFAREAIIDVTGQMQSPLSVMREVADGLERMSLHPLFAPHAAPGRIAAVIDADGPHVRMLCEQLGEAGNELVETDPVTHDRSMRTIQGAAHAAIFAYGLAAEEVPPELHTPVSETLEGLLARVTEGDPSVYREIQQRFDGIAALGAAADKMAADPTAIDVLYDPPDRGE